MIINVFYKKNKCSSVEIPLGLFVLVSVLTRTEWKTRMYEENYSEIYFNTRMFFSSFQVIRDTKQDL